jgi:hypothetical protein
MNAREVIGASKPFVLPSELTGSRPRDVQLTGGGRVLYGFAVALLVGAVVLTIVLGFESSSSNALRETFRQDSVEAEAAVTRLWRESNDSKQPWVAYRFDANGTTVYGRAEIKIGRWRSLQTGDSIGIRYLPSNPETNLLAGKRPDALPLVVPPVVGGLMVGVGLLMFAGLNSQRTLLAEGRAAAAVVTAVVKHKSQHGTHRSLKYSFRLLNGAIATGKSDAPSKPPEVGGVICIVYDPDRPGRNRRYPFSLVKTARL